MSQKGSDYFQKNTVLSSYRRKGNIKDILNQDNLNSQTFTIEANIYIYYLNSLLIWRKIPEETLQL